MWRIPTMSSQATRPASKGECAFCVIVHRDPKSQLRATDKDCVVFEPLDPVVPGHVLVVPRKHIADFTYDPEIFAACAEMITIESQIAKEKAGGVNLIASAGIAATQSIFHLHFHIVPRNEDDGLFLPWTLPPVRSLVGR